MTDPVMYNNDELTDINIREGYVELLPDMETTADQRAAVAAYIIKGTIPGAWDIGVDWSTLLEGNSSLTAANNNIRETIELCGGTDGTITGLYMPITVPSDKGITITVLKTTTLGGTKNA